MHNLFHFISLHDLYPNQRANSYYNFNRYYNFKDDIIIINLDFSY
jgi:hypothetical protein